MDLGFLPRVTLEKKGSKYKNYRNSISDGIALVRILKIAAEDTLLSSHHDVAKEPKSSFAFVWLKAAVSQCPLEVESQNDECG